MEVVVMVVVLVVAMVAVAMVGVVVMVSGCGKGCKRDLCIKSDQRVCTVVRTSPHCVL